MCYSFLKQIKSKSDIKLQINYLKRRLDGYVHDASLK